MKLTLFPADKGDCFLVTSSDGRRMLVDGGMSSSYKRFVAPTMAGLAAAGEKLDLICISHIDQDHIAGILQMLDSIAEWHVHEFQLSTGNGDHRPPEAGRPPEIAEIWHNAFEDQVGDNADAITDALAASGLILSGAAEDELRDQSEQRQDLVTSVGEAIRVSRRIHPDQLGIPLNTPFGGGLVQAPEAGAPVTVAFGSATITVIAPFAEQLADLSDDWAKWLSDNADALDDIATRAAADAEVIGTSLQGVVAPLEAQAQVLGADLVAAALGDINKVTVPNLASIMLLLEEDATTFLLTGDGHSDHILKGLELTGHLAADATSGMHVSVLKVQHHGSEHNIDEQFAQRITADNYVFCADGAHTNPEVEAVEVILASRLGDDGHRSTNPEATRPFTFWFNSSPEFATSDARRAHLETVRHLVETAASGANGQLRVEFRTQQQEENAGWDVFP